MQTMDLLINYFRDVRLDTRTKDIGKMLDSQLQSERSRELLRDAVRRQSMWRKPLLLIAPYPLRFPSASWCSSTTRSG